MKFYRYKYKKKYSLRLINFNKLTVIYSDDYAVVFLKDGLRHNTKNFSYINNIGYKQFCLNGKYYGDQTKFTKYSWRRFVKLQAFL